MQDYLGDTLNGRLVETKSENCENYSIWVNFGEDGVPARNLRRLHRPKNNHRKIIDIGQIIGSGQIDSFMCIESIIQHFAILI